MYEHRKSEKLKKLEKEAVLKERMVLISAVSFFIFILPYILHLAVNGIQPAQKEYFGSSTQTICVRMGESTEHIQLEAYLTGALARHGEAGYEDEALKAIAVILRSNAVCAIIENKDVFRESFYTDEELRILWKEDYEANLQRYRDIIVATEGIVVFYDGEIVRVPYHLLSAGTTRDSSIYVNSLAYVTSVDSAEDMYADGYYSTREIKKDILGEDFEVLSTDHLGYALIVKVGNREMSGEEFRRAYGLPSACFDYDLQGNNYFFEIRGCGHGFGVSLYGTNALAHKGWGFAEILEYYLPGIEIRKENRSDISA